ncbi:corticosteroid 11-beta-dehydrogenase isozyme 2 isoform X2 [Thalassophryne amazonica]|uniref:corticosteroid 11-beta-dehydrogenase isozyme 2 isoform X2 n=1 Tax=Thalassophryne amazonica TaxID=390379 RepID=UPI001470F26B|nr:corticosteroid 11-beta-dehydrogenase isozyme 2 isoform X2 [Thalassophryne amazonica]
MMDDYMLPTWIYLAVLAVIVGSVMKKVLAFHLSSTPALLAWLSFTVLVERLWAFCLPTVLLMALFGLSVWLYSTFRPGALPTLPAHGKAVFITGCDSGFGKAAAMRLDALGFEVFATVLNLSGEGAKELQRTCSPRLTLIQVDITQPQQVQQALLVTKNKLGPNGLWGLVNNAGVCVNFGDAELSLMSNYRGCMEVNFFGTLNVTQSFLPLLRQSKGRLVTISSPAGQSSNQAYWEQQHKHLLQTLSPALLEEYGEDYVTETKELFCSYTSTANPDVSPVIDVIVQALLSPQPLVRYFAGPGIGLMYFLHSYCPVIIRDRFIQKLFLKKKLMPRALRKQSSFDINLKFCNNNNEEKVVQPAMHQQ